jgi:hypothetical protein
LAASCIDSLNPEVAKIALSRFPITVRPILGFHRGIFSIAEKLGSTPAISLSFVENSFTALSAGTRIGCSRHIFYPASAGSSRTGCCFNFRPPTSPVASVPKHFGTGEERSAAFLVEWQVFFNPCLVSFVENGGFSELALALRIFRHEQVSTASVATKHLAGRRHLEAFRHCFLRFASRYRFWHKKSAIYLQDSS